MTLVVLELFQHQWDSSFTSVFHQVQTKECSTLKGAGTQFYSQHAGSVSEMWLQALGPGICLGSVTVQTGYLLRHLPANFLLLQLYCCLLFARSFKEMNLIKRIPNISGRAVFVWTILVSMQAGTELGSSAGCRGEGQAFAWLGSLSSVGCCRVGRCKGQWLCSCLFQPGAPQSPSLAC